MNIYDNHAAKANEMINKLAEKIGTANDPRKAHRILTAVLHGLRNRLTLEENFQFMAQLPLCIKGQFVDGWNPSKKHVRIKHIHEFIDEVYNEGGNAAVNDFPTESESLKAISAVFEILKDQVSQGEVDDIRSVLPKELKQLWDEPVLV